MVPLPSTDPASQIASLLEERGGIFIGDEHFSIAGKMFLTNPAHIAQWQEAGLCVFCAEVIQKKDQDMLETGDKKDLISYIAKTGFINSYENTLSYAQMLLAHREADVRVVAINEEEPGMSLIARNQAWVSNVREAARGEPYILFGGRDHGGWRGMHAGAGPHKGEFLPADQDIDVLLDIPCVKTFATKTCDAPKLTLGEASGHKGADYLLEVPPNILEKPPPSTSILSR